MMSVLNVPKERTRRPVALAIFIQIAALFGLWAVVRLLRPDPVTNSTVWQGMGTSAEFWPVASLAMLFASLGFVFAHAIDRQIDPRTRARECKIILAVQGVCVAAACSEMAYYGTQTGLWGMFLAMAGVAVYDLILTFCVIRYLDIESRRAD